MTKKAKTKAIIIGALLVVATVTAIICGTTGKHNGKEAETKIEFEGVDASAYTVKDVICEECGRNMVIKYGPHGKFLACPGFPECRNTKMYLEKIGVACPICGKDIVIRKTQKGRKYFGCIDIPECDFMTWQKPSGKNCPQCGNVLLTKGQKLVCADEACGYRENKEGEE